MTDSFLIKIDIMIEVIDIVKATLIISDDVFIVTHNDYNYAYVTIKFRNKENLTNLEEYFIITL